MGHVTDTDNWPSFGEELGRKALETVEKWMQRHDAGQIRARELYILVDGLYDTISGLAPKEVCNVIADLHQEIRKSAKKA